jgi:hypothetical protein
VSPREVCCLGQRLHLYLPAERPSGWSLRSHARGGTLQRVASQRGCLEEQTARSMVGMRSRHGVGAYAKAKTRMATRPDQ